MVTKKFDFERLFDSTPDLLCIAGYDGYFQRVNDAVPNLLGYSREELHARPINDFIYEEDKYITSKVRRDLTESIPLYNFENRYVTKDGDIVWLSWTSQPVESEEVIFAIAKNITHKKQLEQERSQLIKNLTQVNKEIKELSLTTSHDLRSPLNSLQSVFELIDLSKIEDQETLELIEILKLTGENLRESLGNFVDALSEKIGQRKKLESVDLQETLHKVKKSIQSLIRASRATVSADFSKENTIFFNQAYLESVFLNLLSNAIKYSRPNVKPRITITSELVDDRVQLIFSDNGLGMNMEKVGDHLFGLNQTFHNNKDSKGIGLYLVHSHITSLGGKITAESEVDRGTTFTMSFMRE